MRLRCPKLMSDRSPRPYTALVIGLAVGAFVVDQASVLSRSPVPVSGGRLLWLAFLSVVAAAALIRAAWGFTFRFVSRRIRADYATRRAGGLCGRCGYDLHAATSARCPECGAWHGNPRASRGRRR